jgi:hypothetical protein
MLARNYRFTVENKLGQTIAVDDVDITARRWKPNASGTLNFETVETLFHREPNTVANNAFFATSGADNTTSGFYGGDFSCKLTAPASSDGRLIIRYEVSTDGGAAFGSGNSAVTGAGDIVAVMNVTTAGTYFKPFSVE